MLSIPQATRMKINHSKANEISFFIHEAMNEKYYEAAFFMNGSWVTEVLPDFEMYSDGSTGDTLIYRYIPEELFNDFIERHRTMQSQAGSVPRYRLPIDSMPEREALMADDINQFLLVFNRATGVLEGIQEFGTDIEAALAAYADAEQTYRDSDWMQVVLIGSDSLDTVQITHANYFGPTGSESGYFAGLDIFRKNYLTTSTDAKQATPSKVAE